MLYAGYLSYEGVLHWWPALICSLTGTTIGMSITYLIGNKAGLPFLERFGKWLLITPNKLGKTKRWFDRFGNILVFIGYFIPGVRHLTGYFAGIVGAPFRTFVIYAYTGALFWCICFIGLGHLFGPRWRIVLDAAENHISKMIILACCVGIVVLIVKWRVNKK